MRVLISLPGTGKSHLNWIFQNGIEPWRVCEYKNVKYADADFADPMRMILKGTMSAISFLDQTWRMTNLAGYVPIVALPPRTDLARSYFTDHYDIKIIAKDYESITKIKNHWLVDSGILVSKNSYLEFVQEQTSGYGKLVWISNNLHEFLEEESLW